MPLTEDIAATPKVARVLKADRPFSPPHLGLRPSSFDVANTLYAYVKSLRQPKEQIRVYASKLNDCARMQAMSIMGFPEEPTTMQSDNPQWAVAAEFGTSMHNLIESWIKEVGFYVDSEFRVTTPDATLSGRVDFQIRPDVEPPPADDLYIVDPDTTYFARVQRGEFDAILDVKTVDDKHFNQGAWGDKISKYIAQISVYGRLLGVRRGIILLVNRNNGKMQDMEFDISPTAADALIKRASDIVGAARAGQLPPPEMWGSFFCTAFCPFYDECLRQNTTGEVQRELDARVAAGTYPVVTVIEPSDADLIDEDGL